MAQPARNSWKIGPTPTGPQWRLARGMDWEIARDLAPKVGIDEVFCNSLMRANIELSEDQMRQLLVPAAKMIVAPERTVPGMDEAGAQLASALQAGARLAIFADYDPDGTCSAGAIARGLREMGHEDQLVWGFADAHSGFGLNQDFVDHAIKQGCTWLMTLDCGSGQAAEINSARAAGLTTVVVDHHHVDEACKPDWHLNPHAHTRAHETPSPNTGAPLAWKLAAALQTARFGRSTETLWGKALYLAGFGCRADLGSHLLPEHRAMFWLPLDRFGTDSIPVGIELLAKALGENANWPGGLILTSACLNLPKRTTLVEARQIAHLLATDDADYAAEIVAELVKIYRRAQQLRRQLVQEAQRQIDDRAAAESATDHAPNQLIWAVLDGYEEWAGYAGAISQDLARQNGGVAVCFMRRTDGRYKLAVRGKRAGRGKLGEMLTDDKLRLACTLTYEDANVEDTINLGGHDEVVSGACEAGNIQAVLAALRPYAAREKDKWKPDGVVLWAEARGVTGDRLILLLEQSHRMAPFNGFEGYYAPRVGVPARVTAIEAAAADATTGPTLTLDADGVPLRILTRKDAAPPPIGETREFHVRLDGAPVLWCGAWSRVGEG